MAVMNPDAARMLSGYNKQYNHTPSAELQAVGVTGPDTSSAQKVPVAFTDDNLSKLYELNADRALKAAEAQMAFQTNANKIAMDFSAAEAEKQRAYSTEMANTAYQRAVQDLRKAGLNPALAYQQGGAAVPSVSAASGVTSAGAMPDFSDDGYKSYELKQEKEIADAKIKQAYVEMFVNAATDLASSAMGGGKKTGKIGF